MMRLRSKARIYARAAYDIAVESGEAERFHGDLKSMAKLVEEVPAFMKAIGDGAVEVGRRNSAIDAISDLMPIADVMKNLVKLLIANGSASMLRTVIDEALNLTLRYFRLAKIDAIVACEEDLEIVKNRVEEITRKILKTETKCDIGVDQSILGGFILKIGNSTLDASIGGSLSRLEEGLLSREKRS